MKKKMLSIFCIIFCVYGLPLTVLADSRTWTPPAEIGKVYIVVKHKKSFPPMKTQISISWGRWSKSGTFDAAGLRYSREGFIIRLDHKKNDSVPITVSTDGSIIEIYQGNPPSQIGDSLWEYKEW